LLLVFFEYIVFGFYATLWWRSSDLHLSVPTIADEHARLLTLVRFGGWFLIAGLTIIGVRMLSYYRSFIFHSDRYRQLVEVDTAMLKMKAVPKIKIQITTRGSDGSTEVIRRGIDHVLSLATEDPAFYGSFLSVEVVTESTEQAELFNDRYAGTPLSVDALVLPASYVTPNGTQLKARALHYVVEQRRRGWNHRPGRTFVVHYDEESVLEPGELRKLIALLADTDKKILEGPIYYPLEYLETSILCRAMEAIRPLACYECRHVMEHGVPLHLHGSNLVIEEEFENDLGWDIGHLDGQPFIAEDYVFGLNAFLAGGPQAFGWHGSVMLEQPPFSVRSARKQRHRWIVGVLQGMAMLGRMAEFRELDWRLRQRLIWGTRYRVACFALSAPVGALSLALMPLFLTQTVRTLQGRGPAPLPAPVMAWIALVGVMWLGTLLIGAWYNVAYLDRPRSEKLAEIGRCLLIAPVAGLLESTAGFAAVIEWLLGQRQVHWQPTPKTKAADSAVDWAAGR